ncbi:MAG TPA: hypothetical protein VK745_16245 [Polyangiaceae bacterium]|jgi:hypothetical protein|nr:hypothetical protein [Polyangiaceae bacterium]
MVISGVRPEQPSVEPTPSAPALRSLSELAPELAPELESPFSRALRGLGREIDVGERQVAGASQLRSYDTGTLIALQAGIYRYTEAVDLASKIVDRASTAIHTVLSGGGH